jgi:hypothetical protein
MAAARTKVSCGGHWGTRGATVFEPRRARASSRNHRARGGSSTARPPPHPWGSRATCHGWSRSSACSRPSSSRRSPPRARVRSWRAGAWQEPPPPGPARPVWRLIPGLGPCRVAGVRAGRPGTRRVRTAARTCVAGYIRTGRFWSDRTCAVRRLDLTAAGTAPASPAGACLGGSSGRDGMVVVPWCLARTRSSAGCGACQRTVTERLQKVSVSDSLVADDESLSDL